MARGVDQREIETARCRALDEPPPALDGALDGGSGPDDSTDLSLPGLAAPPASQWRLNSLGVLLATALVCALLFSLALWVKLSRARADLAEAELAAEMTEAAVARETSAPAGPEAASKLAAPARPSRSATRSRPPSPMRGSPAAAAR